MSSIIVPENVAKNIDFEFDPKANVTYVEDINNLIQSVQDNTENTLLGIIPFASGKDYMKKEVQEQLQSILPNLDIDTFNNKVYGAVAKQDYLKLIATETQNKELLDNKLKYITQLLPEGDTVSNDGMRMDDWWLQQDMSRSETFLSRKKKFLEKYPNGIMTSVKLPLYNDEKIELFKKNSDSENWQFRLPYGRDIGEWGVMTGQVFNMRNAANVAAGLLYDKTAPVRSILGLVGADFLGQQSGKTIEQLRGYGEREFAGEAGVGTLKNYWNNIFSQDMTEALATGGAQIFLNRIINRFTKGNRAKFGIFGTTDKADDYIRAWQELVDGGYNLDPIVYAQIASWPLIRASFFQAKDFVKYPKEVIGKQASELYKQFQKFGVSMNPGDDGITLSQLVKMQQKNEIDLGNLLKPYMDDVSSEAGAQRILSVFKAWDEGAFALEQQLATATSNMALKDGVNFNITPLKNIVTQYKNTFTQKGPRKPYSRAQIKAAKEAGIPLNKYVALEKVPSQFSKVFKQIDDLNDTLWAVTKKKKPGVKDEFVDGKNIAYDWSATTDQLLSIRKSILKLASDEDYEVRNVAKQMYKEFKGVTANPQGGSEAFEIGWKTLQDQLDANDLVRHTTAMKQAINTTKMDAGEFVNRFFDPRMPNIAPLMKKIVPEELVDDVNAAFLHRLTNDPKTFGVKLQEWIDGNPQALKDMVGENKLNELKSLKIIADKYDSSIINNIIKKSDDFSSREFVDFIENEAKKKGLGVEAKLNQFVKDMGGFDSPNLDSVRSGIIHNILRRSTDKGIQKKVYDAGGEEVLDPQKLFVEMGEMMDNPTLSKLFSTEQKEVLKNFDLYVQSIATMEDVGGKIAAGQVRSQIMQSIQDPGAIIKSARTILSYSLMSRLLGNAQTSSMLRTINGNWYTDKGILATRNLLATQLGQITGQNVNAPDANKTGTSYDFVPDSISNSQRSIINKVIESEQGAYSGSETDKLKQEQELIERGGKPFNPTDNPLDIFKISSNTIPAGSRLSNLSTQQKGEQLFKNDITFAAQGGIMNARKQIQRVA